MEEVVKMTKAKILFLDIETAPNKVYTWALFDQNIGINQIIEPSYVLCWAAKWANERTMMSDAIINYSRNFKKHPRDDSKIALSMWKLLDEADIVVTHNGNRFDLKWLNTIFLKHGMPPPSTYASIDTYQQLRTNFRFQSNKLQFSAGDLGLGQKVKHEGFDLWIKCMRGEIKPWKRMVKYCCGDVRLLEDLYTELRPFIKNHPNLALYEDTVDGLVCPNCTGRRFKKKGFAYTSSQKYQRNVCLDCGKNIRDRKCVKKGKK